MKINNHVVKTVNFKYYPSKLLHVIYAPKPYDIHFNIRRMSPPIESVFIT